MTNKRLIGLLLMAASAVAALAGPPAWEHVSSPPHEVVEAVAPDSSTEIVVNDGYIFVYLSKPTSVTLYSILGQPISTEKLPAGVHRLKMNTRGIYILRAGATTRRITL